MKKCEKCGREYEDVLDQCPACAKKRKRNIIIGVVIAVVIIAILKFMFLF